MTSTSPTGGSVSLVSRGVGASSLTSFESVAVESTSSTPFAASSPEMCTDVTVDTSGSPTFVSGTFAVSGALASTTGSVLLGCSVFTIGSLSSMTASTFGAASAC